MKVEYEETKKVQHFKVVCDFCGYTRVDTWADHGTCSVCKKHGCNKCGQFFYEGCSDHHSHYACKQHVEIVRKVYDDVSEMYESIPDIDKLISAYSVS